MRSSGYRQKEKIEKEIWCYRKIFQARCKKQIFDATCLLSSLHNLYFGWLSL